MRVVTFGTYDKRAHPRIGILIEGLRAAGDDVLEVNAPLGIGTAARVAMLKRPYRTPLLLAKLCSRWAQLAWRARRVPAPEAVVVGYLGHFDVHLAGRLFPRSQLVLDQMVFAAETAIDRDIGGRWRLPLLERLDRWAVRCADVVLVDTPQRRDLVGPGFAGDVIVAPVGAQEQWFAVGERRCPRPRGRPLRVVFFGLYTPLHGSPVIGAALSQLADADIEVTMVGSGQDLATTKEAARGNDKVRWQDWAEPEALAQLVADSDVCLGIFGAGRKASSVVPNKVYQGAAAGCAVLTSDTAPQREALGDAGMYVPAGNPDALAAALRALAADPAEVARRQAAARARAEAAFRPVIVAAALHDRLRSPRITAPNNARGGRVATDQ